MPSTRRDTQALTTDLIEALGPLLAQQRQKWAERCQAHGLSLMGFHALSLLEMHGPTPMSRLADDLGVALPNASGIVNRLAERGIVEREHDEADRRVVRVSLTDAGRRLIGEMEDARRTRIRQLVSALDTAQQASLLQSVRDLRDAAIAIDGA